MSENEVNLEEKLWLLAAARQLIATNLEPSALIEKLMKWLYYTNPEIGLTNKDQADLDGIWDEINLALEKNGLAPVSFATEGEQIEATRLLLRIRFGI